MSDITQGFESIAMLRYWQAITTFDKPDFYDILNLSRFRAIYQEAFFTSYYQGKSSCNKWVDEYDNNLIIEKGGLEFEYTIKGGR